MNPSQSPEEHNKVAPPFSAAQLEWLELTVINEPSELAEEIMLIHEIALYHSNYLIDTKEKTALYQLRLMSEILLKIASER